MERFTDKVAIITGASSGIGAALSERFVEAGMTVVGFARRAEKVDELAETLTGKPGRLIARRVDITNEFETIRNIKWVEETIGPVHILVNNAGIMSDNTIQAGDSTKWRKVFDTNVIGLLVATKEAIRIMKDNDIEGVIINVNSVSGHYYLNFHARALNVYGASKFAVTNITETLRRELLLEGSKIKVCSISPGFVATEISTNLGDDLLEGIDKVPILKPEDVADAIAYIVSTPQNVHICELLIRPLGETF